MINSRAVHLLLLAAIVLFGGGCSTWKVSCAADPQEDFKVLKTYWLKPNTQQVLDDRMLMGRPLRDTVAQSIEQALGARGRTAAPKAEAQMIVRWLANIQYSQGEASRGITAMDVRRDFIDEDSPFIVTGTDFAAQPYLVSNGAVAIDIVDAKTHKSVWRGTIDGVIKDKLPDPERVERLDKALAKLFTNLPKP